MKTTVRKPHPTEPSMKLMKVSLFVTLVLAGAWSPAMAGPSMDWDPAYLWQVGATPNNAPLGGELKCVGLISAFDVPFQDLDPSDPNKEYTFYVYGLISQGTVASGPPLTTFFTTAYSGGTIEIYEGSPRDAVFDPNPPNANVPSTFQNGTLILSGSFTSFFTETNNFTTFQTGNAEGQIQWTGGTLLSRTEAVGGVPCPGLFTGGMTWRADQMIAGYLFRHDGKIDLNCPTGTRPGTWGAIKSLYR
jgi:hypothetical protein